MTPALLAALKTDLGNPARSWSMLGHMRHESEAWDGQALATHAHVTYQLRDATRRLILVFTAELIDGDLEVIRLNYDGMAFETADAALHQQLQAMAAPASAAAESALLAKLTG